MMAVVLKREYPPVAEVAEFELAGVAELEFEHGSGPDKVRTEPEILKQAEPKC